MTSSCFLWFSPRGQVSISHANSDYSGDISGDKEATCKIMTKVPMNLISWDSSMEMYQLNALSTVSAELKCRWSMYSPLPWLEVPVAVISWELSSQIEMMDSKHDNVYTWNYSPSFRKHRVRQHCMKIGQYKWFRIKMSQRLSHNFTSIVIKHKLQILTQFEFSFSLIKMLI